MRSILFLAVLSFVACKPNKPLLTVGQIVNKSITASGFNKLSKSNIQFEFRKRKYSASRDNGIYKYERITKKDSSETKDVLSNSGFKRYINEQLTIVPDSMVSRYSNSVNSVHYFSVLPFGLNDKAVYKKLLSSVTIKGIPYYKVQVTFSEDGGGEDFDDVFLYWIRTDNFKLDFLAYKYNTNGGGVRFRDIQSESVINGIRFLNYNNYKPKNPKIDFLTIDKLYENGELKKISEIVLKNISVETFN